jgi:phosphatidylserine/phosphatidylglycerophosphate/cardiolipin synthase-like enzyme
MLSNFMGHNAKMPSTIPKTQSLIGSQYASEVLRCINDSMRSIDILMFEWRWYKDDPSHPIQLINHALVSAVRRGVKVRALTHKKEIADILNSVGIKAKAWPLAKLMHAKMIIFDGNCIIMGSHNLTGSAINTNIETSILFYDEEVAKVKTNFFENICLL